MEQKKTYLIHFGIPGMKWGRRKSKQISSGSKTNKKMSKRALKKAQKEWDKKVNKKWIDNYNKASAIIDNSLTKKYNAILEKEKLIGEKYWAKTQKDPVKMARVNELYSKYDVEAQKIRNKVFEDEFGKRPS